MAENVIRYGPNDLSLEHVPKITEIIIKAAAISIKGVDSGTYAFSYAKDTIQRVSFEPNSAMQSISPFCFYDCTSLSSVDFSTCAHIKSIGNNAFFNCKLLKSINLPAGLTTIGQSVFSYSGIVSIEIPATVENFGRSNFFHCLSLVSFAIHPDSPMTFLTDHQFTETKLTELHLTKSIKDFAGDNFEGVTTITTLDVDPLNKHLKSKENVIFNYEMTTLYYAAPTKTGTYKIPDGVTNIINCAFTQSQITNVEFPDSLINIGGWCFVNSKLVTLEFPPNLVLIAQSAFSGCADLESITFSDSITTIETTCFSGCDKLTSVILPKNLKNLGGSAFPPKVELSFGPDSQLIIYENIFIMDIDKTKIAQCLSSEATLNVPKSVQYIVSSSFSNIKTINKLVFPDDSELKTIQGYAFQYSSLAEINLPDSLEVIETNAFKECKQLRSIYFGNSLKTVGSEAFQICDSLSIVTVSEVATPLILDNRAFYLCPNLGPIDFKGRLTSIGESCFESCKKLTSIAFSSSIKTIMSRAFQFSGITTVTFPERSEMTEFSIRCFYKCTELNSFSFPEGITTINEEAFAYTKFAELVLPASLVTLKDQCFQYCSSLETLTIPQGSQLATFGFGVFYQCTSFRNITKNSDNFEIENDALFNKGKTSLIVLPPKAPCKYFSFPTTLEIVGISALQGCHNIHVIFVPNSVVKIMPYAFNDCINLRSINIPNECLSIGENAFLGCRKMQCGISIENTNSTFLKNLVTVSGLPKRAIEDCIDGCVTINKHPRFQFFTPYIAFYLLISN